MVSVLGTVTSENQLLHFEFQLVLSVLLYLHGFALGEIWFEDLSLEPLQVPAVFYREYGVVTRHHAGKSESSVTVTLVAPEQDLVVYGIIGHRDDHDPGKRLAVTQCNAVISSFTGAVPRITTVRP